MKMDVSGLPGDHTEETKVFLEKMLISPYLFLEPSFQLPLSSAFLSLLLTVLTCLSFSLFLSLFPESEMIIN